MNQPPGQTVPVVWSKVSATEVPCQVLLGKTTVPFEEFLEVKVGDVIKLDQMTEKDLTFMIANVPKFKGRPMMNGKRYVFSITEPIQQ